MINILNEHWKVMSEYNGLYLISDYGRICRGGKIRKQHNDKDGYKTLNLSSDGIAKNEKVHRLVGFNFVNKKHKDQNQINHKDGNKSNNHFLNLEWVTIAENNNHARKIGLIDICGEKNHYSKLSKSDVKEIRSLRKKGYLLREIAENYDTSLYNVSYIVNNKTWNHEN